MRALVGIVVLVLFQMCHAQSLGDVAKENREKPKPSKTSKTITNEDLPAEKQGRPSSQFQSRDLQRELDHVRQVLQGICLDPKTNQGRILSDYDKQSLDEGVKPLRARVNEYERIQKEYKQSFAKIEEDTEIALAAATPKGRPITEQDIQKFKSIRADYYARREQLQKEAEARLGDYRKLQLELEEIGKECPEAAKTVPD
jgi:hypothetical protein